MENVLPIDIIRDIFSRLPVECILQGKRVRKTWRNLPLLDDDAHFARAQLHRQPQLVLDDHADTSYPHFFYYRKVCATSESNHIKVSFLFLVDEYSCVKRQIRKVPYYGEYDCGDGKIKFKEFGLKLQHLPADPSFTLVGSCNGLICFSVSDDSTLVSRDPIYICNPVTKEEMYLPRYVDNQLVINKLKTVNVTSGFGYIPSTNEYKVVRICAHSNEPLLSRRNRIGYVEVYTLGVDSDWRFKDELSDHYLSRPKSDQYVSEGVLVDGALHWLDYYDWKILAFDLVDEVFFEVPSPPCFEYMDVDGGAEAIQLQELQGTLCVCYQLGQKVYIWLYQKNTPTNTNTSGSCIVKMDHQYDTRNWSSESSIIPIMAYSWPYVGYVEHWPIAFTKSGEILFWFNRTVLALYDQKTRTVRKLEDGGNFGRRVLQVIPHVNSFVPLATLWKRSEILMDRS